MWTEGRSKHEHEQCLWSVSASGLLAHGHYRYWHFSPILSIALPLPLTSQSVRVEEPLGQPPPPTCPLASTPPGAPQKCDHNDPQTGEQPKRLPLVVHGEAKVTPPPLDVLGAWPLSSSRGSCWRGGGGLQPPSTGALGGSDSTLALRAWVQGVL